MACTYTQANTVHALDRAATLMAGMAYSNEKQK
jgi:hypothetical protein